MKIEHITNSFAKIGSELASQLSQCASFSIATAFIGASAIDLIEQCLKNNSQLKSGQLLLGVYGYFNLKSDLERLKLLARQYPHKFQVHISKDKSFHWKYYQFEKRSTLITYVGSANFTDGGMGNNAELLLKITGDVNALSIKSSFDKQWENSGSISEFPLNQYPETIRKRLKVSISKEFDEFFRKAVNPAPSITNTNENAIVFHLTSDVRSSTSKKIYGYKPSWNKDKIHFLFVMIKNISNTVSMQKNYC